MDKALLSAILIILVALIAFNIGDITGEIQQTVYQKDIEEFDGLRYKNFSLGSYKSTSFTIETDNFSKINAQLIEDLPTEQPQKESGWDKWGRPVSIVVIGGLILTVITFGIRSWWKKREYKKEIPLSISLLGFSLYFKNKKPLLNIDFKLYNNTTHKISFKSAVLNYPAYPKPPAGYGKSGCIIHLPSINAGDKIHYKKTFPFIEKYLEYAKNKETNFLLCIKDSKNEIYKFKIKLVTMIDTEGKFISSGFSSDKELTRMNKKENEMFWSLIV